jgi:2-amino-4-hydroxy-6-hydroxymethyldihydropteridine diphosphokinase
MIVIGVGANLAGPSHATPLETCQAAIETLAAVGAPVLRQSPWYESAPVPASDQPWFINAVVVVDSVLSAPKLLQRLHRIEAQFGRVRRQVNAARTLDLDILDFDGAVTDGAHPEAPRLPHPRLQERAFVLLPLRDVAPDWRHPVSGKDVATMIAELDPGQTARPMANP